MIFFNKELSLESNITNIVKSLCTIKETNIKNEKFFKELYNRERDNFLFSQYVKSIHLSSEFIVSKIKYYDKKINNMKLEEVERKLNQAAKESYISMMKWRKERSLKFPYNENELIKYFENVYSDNLKYLSKFPSDIIEKIADLRVFALGYVSEKVRKILFSYFL